MTTKSFKGLLDDGSTDQIYLHGGDPTKGYRIHKFLIIPNTPGANIDSTMKIFKKSPAAANAEVDFTDPLLIGVAWIYNDTYETQNQITFDNEVFNQDIYIQHYDDKASNKCNYYLELEEVTMSDAEQAVVNFNAVIENTS